MSALSAGLVYALLSLDHIAVGPFLLSRPVVVGAAVGAVLGNGPLGFSAGLAVELLYIAVPPIGLTAKDVSIMGGLAALWSVQAHSAREASLLLSLLLAAPAGLALTEADRWLRRQNDRFSDWILGHLKEGRERVLWKALGVWAAIWFLKSWVLFVAAGFLGQAAVDGVLRFSPPWLLDGLDRGGRLLPAACLAASAAYFWDRVRPRREEEV